MSQILIKSLTKCLVDALIVIEFSDKSIADDVAVEVLEKIGAELQSLPEIDKTIFISEIRQLSMQYPAAVCEFVENIPENFGIIDC